MRIEIAPYVQDALHTLAEQTLLRWNLRRLIESSPIARYDYHNLRC